MKTEIWEKGYVTHTSPECPEKNKVLALILWLFLNLLFFIMAFFFFHYGITARKVSFIALGLFFIGFGIFAGSSSCQKSMHFHYRIFSKGIEYRTYHWQPFSKCNKFRDGLDFVKWKDIAGFNAVKLNNNYTILVHFNILDNRGGRKWPWAYVQSGDAGREEIKKLIKELKKYKVKEISQVCPTCKKRTALVPKICPYCRTTRSDIF